MRGLRAGDTIGVGRRYRIERPLGRGGFGRTYLARRLAPLAAAGALCAIKEYWPSGMDLPLVRCEDNSIELEDEDDSDRVLYQEGLAGFRDEAKRLSVFEHDNIVKVEEWFEQHNTVYMVMRYEAGRTLDELVAEETLDQERVLALLLPILDGLQHVHDLGYAHRDIKPSNIIVREDGSPVLIDFGAARQTLRGTRTLTAFVSGAYTPIEQYGDQIEGLAQGPWTDIYGVAATLYRMIVGEPPAVAVQRRLPSPAGSDLLTPVLLAAPKGYRSDFLKLVDWGLEFLPDHRPRDVATWRRCFEEVQECGESTTMPRVAPARAGRIAEEVVGRMPPRPAGRVRRRRALVALAAGAVAVAASVTFLPDDPARPPPLPSPSAETLSVPPPPAPVTEDVEVLKEAVRREAAAARLDEAEAGLARLRELLPATDPFLREEGPRRIAEALLRTAGEHVSAGDHELALRDLSRSEQMLPGDEEVLQSAGRLRRRVAFERSREEVQRLFAGAQTLDAAALRPRLEVLASASPDGWPGVAAGLVDRRLARLEALPASRPAQAARIAGELETLDTLLGTSMDSHAGRVEALLERLLESVDVTGHDALRGLEELLERADRLLPERAGARRERLGDRLAIGIVRVAGTDPERAQRMLDAARDMLPGSQALGDLLIEPPVDADALVASVANAVEAGFLLEATSLLRKLASAAPDHPRQATLDVGIRVKRRQAEGLFNAFQNLRKRGKPDACGRLEAALDVWADNEGYAERFERECAGGAGAARRGCAPRSQGECRDVLAGGALGPLLTSAGWVHGGVYFALGKYEVSVAEFRHYCEEAGACPPDILGGASEPVRNVSLEAARGYLRWLSAQTGATYRLPEEEEWRMVASGLGASSPANCATQMLDGDGKFRHRGFIKPARKAGTGVQHLLGNVWEWVTAGGRALVAGGSIRETEAYCRTLPVDLPSAVGEPEWTGLRVLRELTAP